MYVCMYMYVCISGIGMKKLNVKDLLKQKVTGYRTEDRLVARRSVGGPWSRSRREEMAAGANGGAGVERQRQV